MPSATITIELTPERECAVCSFTVAGVPFEVNVRKDGYVGVRPLTPFRTKVETSVKITASNNAGMTGVYARLNPFFDNDWYWGKNGLVPEHWRSKAFSLYVKVKIFMKSSGVCKYRDLVHALADIVGFEEESEVADAELKYHLLCASLVKIVTA
jgi:hypothetical protein